MRSASGNRSPLLAVYSGFVQAVCICLYPFLRCLAFLPGAFGEGLRERLGLPVPSPKSEEPLWIHAASVGEANAIRPLIREIAARNPRRRIVVSIMTSAGKKRMKSEVKCRVVHPPLDVPFCVARFIRRLRPGALAVAETELWPVTIVTAAERMPVFWVNGRISDRTYPRYRFLRPFMKSVLSAFSGFYVISKLDAKRIISLGAPRSRVRVMGNLKADMLSLGSRPGGIPGGEWFVAGSTRPGEEMEVIRAFSILRRKFPRVRLAIAPRHLNRAAEVARMAEKAEMGVSLRSRGFSRRSEVLVLDTHGELASFYRLARAAFVGGTLVPVGGHNVLEPALAGCAVYFGPFNANVREETAALLKSGGAFQVRSGRELGRRLSAVWGSRGLAVAGRRARSCAVKMRGAASRTAAALAAEGVI